MVKRRVMFTFTSELITEPIIYRGYLKTTEKHANLWTASLVIPLAAVISTTFASG